MKKTVLSMLLCAGLSVSFVSHAMYADCVKHHAGERFEKISKTLKLTPQQTEALQKINLQFITQIKQKREAMKEDRMKIETAFKKGTPNMSDLQPIINHMQTSFGEILSLRLEERIQLTKELTQEQVNKLDHAIEHFKHKHPHHFSEF